MERASVVQGMGQKLALGIDVGGTYTDVLLLDRQRRTIRVAKVPTTPRDQADGFLTGITSFGVPLDEVGEVVHATTTGTNALLERRGARVGVIATRGFRDILELGRRTRPSPYGLTGEFEALAAREDRLEVSERVSADGRILVPLDEAEVRDAVRRLADAGCEALIIHFLHASLLPDHEIRAVAIARALWPNGYVSASHEILCEMREFERGSTAAVHAYVQPTITRYIGNVRQRLLDAGYRQDLLVTQANGGTMSAAVVPDNAAQTILSGPAAGVLAAAAIGQAAGYPHLLTGDMGGTSFDVALIRDGQPAIATDKDIAYSIPVWLPMVDIHTIGAGGGSIARVTDGGLLAVGPQSAGSDPGPVGYGRGGTEPTITDANLLLGRLDPATVPGGRSADLAAVTAALAEVGRPLGLDAEGAATAILRVANASMADAMRLVSVARGVDPRSLVYFPFGGAGPMHAVELARDLGIRTILVPPHPGLTSALGCLVADLRHDFVVAVNRPIDGVDAAFIEAALDRQIAAGRAMLAREGATQIAVSCQADLLFRGQSHVLQVPVEHPGATPEALHRAFTARFLERFGIELDGMPVLLSNLRTTVTGLRMPLDFDIFAPKATAMPPPEGERLVWFPEGWHPTPIYSRALLPEGAEIAGPAVINQTDTTLLLDPRSRAVVDRFGNIVVHV